MPRHADSDSQTDGDASSFENLKDEGNHYMRSKLYFKAIDSYNKALEINPTDKSCKVARAKCFLQTGNAEKALVDAEESLMEDKDYFRGLVTKAEAMYQLGDFEFALVNYHRANKLRGELQDPRIGIQKAEEAILNSIGTPDAVQLDASGDLSYFFKHEEEEKRKAKAKQVKSTYQKPGAKKDAKKERRRPKSGGDAKSVKQLLGELYGDREFLEKLMKELDKKEERTDTEEKISDKAIDGLCYLDSRADFWRQQKPMYARKRDKERTRHSAKHQPRDPRSFILRSLDEIEEDQADGNYEQSLKKAQKVLKQVEGMSSDELQNRAEIMATLYSCIGNAYLEMSNFSRAMEYHERDLEIAKDHDLEDAKSRALDNLGRVYARKGSFEKAIEVWTEKIPLSKSPLENAWLFHEIGRCHLELQQYVDAKDYGRKALEAAKEAEDDTWKLHSCVLRAQAEAKSEDLQAAAASFEEALEIARLLEDHIAEQAIKKALDEINNKIVRGEGDEEEVEQRPGTAGSVKIDSRPGSTAMDELKTLSQTRRQKSPDASLKTPRGSARTKSPIKPPATPLGSRGRSPVKEARLSPAKSPALDRLSPTKSPAPDRLSPTKEGRMSPLKEGRGSPTKRTSVSFHEDTGSQKGQGSAGGSKGGGSTADVQKDNQKEETRSKTDQEPVTKTDTD